MKFKYIFGLIFIFNFSFLISEDSFQGYNSLKDFVLPRVEESKRVNFIEQQKKAVEDLKAMLKFKYEPKLPMLDEYNLFSLGFDLLNKKNFEFKDSFLVDIEAKQMQDFLIIGDSLQSFSLYSIVQNHINTLFGKIFGLRVLLHPTTDIDLLNKRISLTKMLVQQLKKNDTTIIALKNIKKCEQSYFSFYLSKVSNIRNELIKNQYVLKNMAQKWGAYVPVLEKFSFLEKKTLYKQVSLFYTMSPFAFLLNQKFLSATVPDILIPNFVKTFEFKLGFYAFAMVMHYLSLRQQEKVIYHMHQQLNDIASMVRSMKCIDNVIQNNSELKSNLLYAQDLHALFDKNNTKVSKAMMELLSMFSTNTFKSTPSFFSLKGRVLAAYAIMEEVKEEFISALHAVGEFDAYHGVAFLYKYHENSDFPCCYAEYIQDSEYPIITIDDMWNPLIYSQNPYANRTVKNSLSLGEGNFVSKLIITGPNAGGKSTFMKNVGMSIMLAQTFGIVPAKSFKFTPFSSINSYMNITDNLEKNESLFKAEVKSVRQLFDNISQLDKKKFSFTVVDEMFRGTSPKEGAAATFAIVEKINKYPNSVLLLTTHYLELTKFSEQYESFKNCQVRVIRNEDGTITYPFKLEDGFTTQNVAFDILRQEGLDVEIFDGVENFLNE